MSYDLNALLGEIASLPEFFNCKVDVNMRGAFGNYPIHAVCTWQDKDAVETLISNGADINSVGERAETPIFRPLRDNNLDFLEFLLLHGANKNVRNEDGLTPLDIARAKGFDDIVSLLESFQR